MKMLVVLTQEHTRWHFIVQNIFTKKNTSKGGKRHTSLLLHHICVIFLNSDKCIKYSKYLKANASNTFYVSNLKYYPNFNKGMSRFYHLYKSFFLIMSIFKSHCERDCQPPMPTSTWATSIFKKWSYTSNHEHILSPCTHMHPYNSE